MGNTSVDDSSLRSTGVNLLDIPEFAFSIVEDLDSNNQVRSEKTLRIQFDEDQFLIHHHHGKINIWFDSYLEQGPLSLGHFRMILYADRCPV